MKHCTREQIFAPTFLRNSFTSLSYALSDFPLLRDWINGGINGGKEWKINIFVEGSFLFSLLSCFLVSKGIGIFLMDFFTTRDWIEIIYR